MARFFIDRPIFAWVIAIIIMGAGILSILTLPVSQYPQIAPPSITVRAAYPGASAETVANTVTQVIEQRMTGLDGLRYFSSSSTSAGSSSITLTFETGTDPDIAQVQVQNKLSQATPLLPETVQRQGVTVQKSTASFLMVIALISDDGSLDQADLADYMNSNLVDEFSRIEGVGEVQVFGSKYAMRIWLDPSKLAAYGLTPSDVVSAVSAENAQISAGSFGSLPTVEGQQLNATITAQSLLSTPEDFEQIVLRAETDGGLVLLKDVARVEVGAQDYSTIARFNGKPSAGMAIRLASGANALDTADRIKKRLEEYSAFFPENVSYVIPYDTTPFVRLSIEEVVKTLAEAIVLVFLVMLLFLQNFRATLIPTLAVPVVLLGTFGILAAAGFSINTLTMLAMVLAIGLLVDDAIVVVENVERIMEEEDLGPLEATRKSMGQITGALIGIALVLSAVFVPMAFFGGSTGVIYQQFSITIVSAMALSVLVALTLTPALCATLLRKKDAHHAKRGPTGWFNRGFDGVSRGYGGTIGWLIRRPLRVGIVYLALVGGMAWIFTQTPTAFLPDEDQGILLTLIQAPTGATAERTLEVVKKVENHFLENEKDNVEFGVRRRRVQLRRTGPEHGACLRAPEGLVGASVAGAKRAGDRGSRLRRAQPDQGRAGVPDRAARRAGTGDSERFRLLSRSAQRAVARRVAGRPQPDARHGDTEPDDQLDTSVRPRGRGAVPPRYRLARRRRDGAFGDRCRPAAFGGLGRVLRQRLYRPRPHQARLRPGRSGFARNAGRPDEMARAQRQRRPRAVLQLRRRPLDLRAAGTGPL